MKATYLMLAASSLLAGSISPTAPVESELFRLTALRDPDFQPAETINHYRTYDFAPLLLPRQSGHDAVVGFIGPNCQRLQIRLLSARRDSTNPTRYYLAGKARVLGHVSNFSGTLVLTQARELRQLAPNGEAAIDAVVQAFKLARHEGFVLGTYELRENLQQPKSGVFRGVARLNWYVDKYNRLHYDEVYGEGDGFCNNQFVGTWTSYTTQKSLRCNWGDYRIPNAGDFDIGADEFSPADKYLAYGWQDVRDCTFGNANAARSAACQRESRIWWQ